MTDDEKQREPLGYVLVNPCTHEMDWDGEIHPTIKIAVAHAVAMYEPRLDEPRPLEVPDDAPRIAAVVLVDGGDEQVLRALQQDWTAAAEAFAGHDPDIRASLGLGAS